MNIFIYWISRQFLSQLKIKQIL